MKKRGQFYLIAIFVIISILIGFIVITNYASGKTDINMDYLKEEINIEKIHVFDYISQNNLQPHEANEILLNFTKTYINSESEKNFYFLFGTPSGLRLVVYQQYGFNIIVNIDDQDYMYEPSPKEILEEHLGSVDENSKVKITIDLHSFMGEETYEFKIQEGLNMYFIITTHMEEERWVITN